MKRALLLAVAALALVAASPRTQYVREVDGWTRKLTVYRSFSTALILRATLLEPAFRADLEAERTRLLDPTPDNAAEFARRMDEDGGLYHELLLCAGDGIPGDPRFGDGDDAWNLRLVVDGEPAELVTVYEVDDPTPLHLALYPQFNQWSKMWIARFHRTIPEPETIVLHVGSGWGHGELTWTGLGSGEPGGKRQTYGQR